MTEEETTQKSKLLPLVSVLAVVGIFFASQIVAVNIVGLFGLLLGQESSNLTQWLTNNNVAVFALRALIALLSIIFTYYLLKLLHSSWHQIGFNRPKIKHAGQALIGYGWYMLLFIGTNILVGTIFPDINNDQQQQLGFDRATTATSLLIMSGVALVILTPIYEEILMRGVLFTGLRKRLSLPLTALIVSVIFGAAHLEWGGSSALNWAAAIDTAVFSIVLVYLREKSKSLWPAIFLHAAKNLIAFTIVFVLKLA